MPPRPICIQVSEELVVNIVQSVYTNSIVILVPQIGKVSTWLEVSLESMSGLPLAGEGLNGSHVSYCLGKPRDDEEHLVQRVFAKRLMKIFSHLYPNRSLVLGLGIKRSCTKQVLQAIEQHYDNVLNENRTALY